MSAGCLGPATRRSIVQIHSRHFSTSANCWIDGAPITIAGHVAQKLAESFCGLVIHQLKAKGVPLLWAWGTGLAGYDDQPVLL